MTPAERAARMAEIEKRLKVPKQTPTIEELEAILNGPAEPPIEILPNGELCAAGVNADMQWLLAEVRRLEGELRIEKRKGETRAMAVLGIKEEDRPSSREWVAHAESVRLKKGERFLVQGHGAWVVPEDGVYSWHVCMPTRIGDL